MPYRVLSHTADTGIEATSDSMVGLIGELAAGMFALMAPLDPDRAREWVEVKVEAPTVEDLVVEALSSLLYQSEVEDLLFCAFSVDQAKDGGPGLCVEVKAGGVPTASVEAIGPAIKAVTYYQLAVEQRADGWYGRVYFDV